MISADFNQDGWLDIAVSDAGMSRVNIRLSDQQGGFGETASYATGYFPGDLASADFNRDGTLDIVTGNGSYEGGVSLLLGNGDGTFAAYRDLAPAQWISRVETGDINGDKIPDLITDADSYALLVFLGNGDGTFADPITYSVGSYISWFGLADLNADTRADLLFLAPDKGSINVMLGQDNGEAPLAPATSYATGADYPRSVAVGDVNNDLKLDVVVASNYPNLAAVMLGDGMGGLRSFLIYPTSGASIAALADFDRDDNLDLALLGTDAWGNSGSVVIRLGTGTGGFGKETEHVFPPNAGPPVAGDFDKDGLLDIATLGGNSTSFLVLSGKGDGSFEDTGKYPTLDCPYSLTLGDVSQDGELDLITSSGNGRLDVYLGPIQSLQQPDQSVGLPASEIKHADLDADGLEDLITSLGSYRSIAVLFGKGGGQFGNVTNIDGGLSYPVVIADIERDGWQDIVSFDYDSYTIGVNRNLGHRKFAPFQRLLETNYVYDFAVGDLNGDELPDLIVATWASLNIALASGPGAYASPASSVGVGFAAWVKLADFNRDGKLDVATASYSSVTVRLGSGDGLFATEYTYPTQTVAGFAVDDVNGDGSIDIVTFGSMVGLLLAKGDGTFASESLFGYAPAAGGMAIGDMNGDGWPDIALSQLYSSPCWLNVLYGRCR